MSSGRNVFNSVHVPKVQRNRFDLSHDVKLSLQMGTLTPINIQEVIPGDSFSIKSESLIRFAPLVAPVMHRINVYIHYFFVPNRIIWDNWETFITDNDGKGNVPAPPKIIPVDGSGTTHIPWVNGRLGDYLGLPTFDLCSPVSGIPFAAYQKIWNEYYRDQNLQAEVPINLPDGLSRRSPNDPLIQLRRRAWEHDYFTASLPFAQKGGAVTIPLGSYADIVTNPLSGGGSYGQFLRSDTNAPMPSGSIVSNSAIPGALSTSSGTLGYYDPRGSLRADLSQATSATINDLRRAFRLQEWLEKMARGGSRYIEQNLMHFGVRSSDQRMQRPEFIGGSKNPVIISEVLQTSESQGTPQGSMAGHGLAASSGKNIKYRAEEHGYILGIMSIMPKTAYQQGIPRHFSRDSHLDYAWPTFAHIGEQAVLNKEIYSDNTAADNGTWGYVPRYSEYRYQDSRVAGQFRDSLAFWHLGRIFGSRPALNASFIECVPRNDIFAVTSQSQNIWAHVYNNVSAKRALPRYGTPTM